MLSRFLKGLIYGTVSFAFCFCCVVDENIYHTLIENGWQMDNAHRMSQAFSAVFGFFAFVYFIKALYFIKNYEFEIPQFEDRTVDTDMTLPASCYENDPESENIAKIMRYREGVLSTMSMAEKAAEFSKTAWVDGMLRQCYYGGGEQVLKTRSFVNGKLGAMGNAEGYSWLKSGTK